MFKSSINICFKSGHNIFFSGFNAAKLAGLPGSIIREGFAMALEFERREARRAVFQAMLAEGAAADMGQLAARIAAL